MMAGKYSNFKSHSSIKAEEEERQKAREIVLENAKRKYEAEEARIEKAKKAGEGTWMLDSLSRRLDKEKKVLDKAKKKKKKEKKKKKKKEKKKKRSSSTSSSSSEDEGSQWVEKGQEETSQPSPAPQRGPQLQRESWMEAPLDFLPLTSRQEIREKQNQEKAEAKREANKMLEPGQHVRELNPYWKNGGTGLPPEKKDMPVRPQEGSRDRNDRQFSDRKHSASDMGRKFARPRDEGEGGLAGRSSGYGGKTFARPRDDDDETENGSQGSLSRRSPDNGNREMRRWKKTSSHIDTKRRERTDRDRRDRRRSHSSSSSDSTDRSRSRLTGRQFARPGDSSDEESRRRQSTERGRMRRSSERGSRDGPRWRKESEREKTRPERGERDRTSRRSRSDSSLSDAETRKRPVNSQQNRRFAKPGMDSDDDEGGDRGLTKRRSPLRSSAGRPRWKKKSASPERLARDEDRDSRDSGRRTAKKSRSPSSSSSGSESESESDTAHSIPEKAPVQILSEEELNDLAAKILRAEIMGDDDLAAELKSKLESARKQREAAKSGTDAAPDFTARRHEGKPRREGKRKGREAEGEKDDNVVVLSRTNKSGMVRPVLGETTERWGGGGGKKRKKNVATHDTTGMRTVYFDNDDKFDLKTLVEQEKAGTAEDQNAMFARLAGRSVDRDLDVDDMFVSRAAKKQDDEKAFNKDKAAAVFEHRKQTSAMEKCPRCLTQAPKHLIIALGTKSYLCLPPHRSLTEGHCLIVPMVHCGSVTALDEDVWQEMQHFRKSLVQMFAEQDQDLVVMETVMHLKHFPHTALECVPLEKEVGDMAPIYFKKAIQEAGPEWSDNKKLHDLRGKDVRRVIPKGFPYFTVDFGADSGYATVIEDESTFPAYFGREIVGGMLDAEPSLWRKPHKQSFEDQRTKVLQFEKWWKPHDWTQDLSNAT